MLTVCWPLHVHLWISAVALPIPYSPTKQVAITTILSMTPHTLTFPKVNGCRQKAACIGCILFL